MKSISDLIHTLFFGKYAEYVRYAFFGVLNVVVTWASYSVLVLLGVDPVFSNIASWIIGVAFAFVCNKFWVFESTDVSGTTLGKEIISFVGGRLLTGVVSIVGFPILYMIGLNQAILGIDGMFAKILITVIEIALNFVISKYLVFRKRK